MLSSRQVSQAAALLSSRLGEVTIAAAILRSQEAARRGAYAEIVDWRRIAERSCAVQRHPSNGDRNDDEAGKAPTSCAPLRRA